MRAFITTLVAALLGAVLATDAFAQGKPADSDASAFVGRWNGVKDWNGDVATPYDGAEIWDLNADGTFVDHAGERGVWSVSGNRITFQYSAGGMTIYTGTLIGDTVLGTMHNSDSSFTGIFAMRR